MPESAPLRIGVLSDTHDRLPLSVVQQLETCDQLWHLGDVCEPATLQPLEKLGIPLHLVRGNCDATSHWPWSLSLHLAGKNFHLVHIPPAQAPAGTHVLLHGHTHVPRDQSIQGTRFLNPGCITRPNRGAPPSFAFLHLSAQGTITWDITRL
jgi:uncharacterized protein